VLADFEMTEQPDIETRLKDLFDETRLAMLGTQLLLSLQYRAAFTDAFNDLPLSLAALNGLALLLILAAAVLLLAVPALHHKPHCRWTPGGGGGHSRRARGREGVQPQYRR
jgi:hypothetical protein